MNVNSISKKECRPTKISEYPSLENKLKKNHSIHGFRSGGGLRVVRLEKCENDSKRGSLEAYGEHPYVYNALQHLEEDCAAGGREYNKVYGPIHDHYLTGAYAESGCNFDAWACAGNGFDIFYRDGEFVFESEYRKDYRPSQEVVEEWKKTRKPQRFEINGLQFFLTSSDFGNGYSWRCLNENVKGVEALWQKLLKVCKAPTLAELIVKLDKELVPNERD